MSDSASRRSRVSWLLPLAVAALLAAVWCGWEYTRIELSIASTPSGAIVRLDGERLGLTPLTTSAPAGRHRITLDSEGYRRAEQMIEFAAGDRVVREFTLERGKGTLAVFSNPRGAWVELDGVRVEGATPLEIEQVSGPVRVRIGLPERHTDERAVVVLDGARTEVRVELEQDRHAPIVMRVRPRDAVVELPDLGLTYAAGLRVPLGEHLVEARRAGYRTRRIRVRVGGRGGRAEIALEPIVAPLELRAEPADAELLVSGRDPDGLVWRERWRPGLEVPVGAVEVQARALGYRTAYRRIEHHADGSATTLRLEQIDVTVGERFRDVLANGDEGPVMVVLPAGRFFMGAADGPPSQRPRAQRTLNQPFALSAYEVSVADYLRFVDATGARIDERLGEKDEPVRYVSHAEAEGYATWLSEQTGSRYRLPTEAEWEYAARAGSERVYGFADEATDICAHANLADVSTRTRYDLSEAVACDDGAATLAPVGRYEPNAFRLHDMLGNVSEWVRECGMPDYEGAPADGARVNQGAACSTHGHRGGSWDGGARALQIARRATASGRKDDVGIRLLKEL